MLTNLGSIEFGANCSGILAFIDEGEDNRSNLFEQISGSAVNGSFCLLAFRLPAFIYVCHELM